MKPNRGKCPPEAAGKRVRVTLADGTIAKTDWPADGRDGCRWSLAGQPHDIAFYEVVA